MKVILFTKDLDEYKPFFDKLKKYTNELKIIYSKDHPFRSDNHFSSFIDSCANFKPDLIISFYYNRIMQKEIINLSNVAVNFHNSLLPNYAGAHAINWQIINGENKTGVTIHEISNIIDGGKIVAQRSFEIKQTHTALDVLKNGINCSVEMLPSFIKNYKNNTLEYRKQIRDGSEFICRKRTPKDGELFADMTKIEIHNMIRALVAPWPGSFYRNKKGDSILVDRYCNHDHCERILKELIKNEK